MIDELDALARLGDETALPTAEARAGARLALEHAISVEQAGRYTEFRRPALRRLAAVGAAAAAVVAVVVIVPLVRTSPPTPANLAQLNVTIPTGFTQTPPTALNPPSTRRATTRPKRPLMDGAGVPFDPTAAGPLGGGWGMGGTR